MSSFSRALLPAGSGPELAAAVTAEALGSALFQLVAGAARAAASGNSAALTGAPSLAPFAIMAAGYAALSSALRPASGGHLNPALSLAAVLGGRLAAASFLAYAAAQLGGGVVGSMLSSLTVPGARLFRRAGAVGCLAHPASAAAALRPPERQLPKGSAAGAARLEQRHLRGEAPARVGEARLDRGARPRLAHPLLLEGVEV